MKKIAVALAVAGLCACKSEPTTVDEASVQAEVQKYVDNNVAKLAPPEQLQTMVLQSYGVPRHEHSRFLEIYQRFLKYRAALPEELQRATGAMRLTLELSQDDPGDTLLGVEAPKAPTAEDPAYMAYALHLGPGVDSATVDDPGTVQQLAGMFQTAPRAIKRGLWTALRLDRDSLANAVVGLMERELKRGSTLTAERFADHVLVPYLTFVSQGLSLTSENEAAVAEAFGRTLGDAKLFTQAIDEVRYHLNGEEPQVKQLHKLNAALLQKDLFLYLVPGQISLVRPHPYRIPAAGKAIDGVRAVTARGLARRLGPPGCWPYADTEVVLPIEVVAASRDVARALAAHGTLPYALTDETAQLWRDQGLDLDPAKVKGLYQDLAAKALEGGDDATLLADLFFDAALLQSRCALVPDAGAGWDSVDRAVASRGAQLALGRRPELHLIEFIQQVQDERLASSLIAHNDRLDVLLKALWKIAADRSAGAIDREGLRAAARGLHTAHRLLKGDKTLPDLDAFQRDVVQAHLAAAPAFAP